MNPTSNSLALVLIAIAAVTAIGQESDPVLTNEQVVSKAFRDVVGHAGILDGLIDIRVEPVVASPGRPLYNGLTEALAARGISVHSRGGAAPKSMTIEILGFDFRYGRGKSRGFLRAPMIKRIFDARVRISLTEIRNGQLLGAEDLAVSYADELNPAVERLIKSRDIPELAPALPVSGWTRIVEPVVVTAAVGGLMYLFFANR